MIAICEINMNTIDLLMLEFSLTIIEQLARWYKSKAQKANRYWWKYNAKSNVASVKTSKFDENVVNIVTESAFFNIGGILAVSNTSSSKKSS